MKVRWHKNPGVPSGWYASVDGMTEPIAYATNTSHTGTEDYPWDWYYTDEGEVMRIPERVGRASSMGTHATLRDVKATVAYQLGETES